MTVKEEIEMINQQSAAIRTAREELKEELEAIEKKATCECDFDCGGDPPSYFRCNRSTLCPVHDMCEVCDERLATVILDGDKCCQACAEDSGLKGQWADSAGGTCLEVQNPDDHVFDPGGWRIIAFVTPNYRKTGFIAKIGGEGLAVNYGVRMGSYNTLEEAKTGVVQALGVEIVETT